MEEKPMEKPMGVILTEGGKYKYSYLAPLCGEEGIDYSLYDENYRLLDGGIYEVPDLLSALGELMEEYGIAAIRVIDADELLEKADEANRICC